MLNLKDILSWPFRSIFKSSPKKMLVLGRPQSGKTTLYNCLLNKKVGSRYEATNYQTIKEFNVKHNDKEIIIGKGVDLPGTIEEQINRLNIDVKKFFKNETSNLMIYIVNCNDIDKQQLIEHAGRILNLAARELYDKTKIAIFYSHPDDMGYKSSDVTNVHKRFMDSLRNDYPRVADKIDEYSLHYVVNLTKREETLEVLFKTFERI